MQTGDKRQRGFTSQDVEIIAKETVFKGFFKMVKYHFKHRLFAGGWSGVVEREMFERGHAAAVLPYDPVTDQVVLIEQIRVGAIEDAHPWQMEIVAGMIEQGETAASVVLREAEEEAGIKIDQLESLVCYYPSSGGCSEKLDLFVGKVDANQAHGIHGLASENEDIKVHVISRESAYQWLAEGVFENSAAIIALQWLQLNYQTLQKQWGQPANIGE